jgi:AraC-like DNA-binding protein
MKQLDFIKNYYSPIQPAVKTKTQGVVYEEVKPHNFLENLVYCYWRLYTPISLEQEFNYRVVSDGCIDIFVNQLQPDQSFVMGFCKKHTEFAIGKRFSYVGIRFLPSAFSLLFGINAKQINPQSEELNKLLPELAMWLAEQLQPAFSLVSISDLLNSKLKEIYHQQKLTPDIRFLNALIIIFEKHGYLDTEKDLNTGLSPRQLQRVFNYYIGTTPKSFCNVVRFQHILNAKPSKASLKNNKFYYDVGFYDQAHFIKSFKTFYGLTPSEAFS